MRRLALPELVFGNGTQGADIVIAPHGAKVRPLVASTTGIEWRKEVANLNR